MLSEKQKALATHLIEEHSQTAREAIENVIYLRPDCIEREKAGERQDFTVYDEGEADQAWEESLDSYLDDCVLPLLPVVAKKYFDREAWKKDARHDGRGHSLSSWDGNEHEYNIHGTYYYIYKN